MFDSPLDALDKNVARKVASGIMSNFSGKTKIIFTNSLEFWDEVDYIYELENGKIIKEGKPSSFFKNPNKSPKY